MSDNDQPKTEVVASEIPIPKDFDPSSLSGLPTTAIPIDVAPKQNKDSDFGKALPGFEHMDGSKKETAPDSFVDTLSTEEEAKEPEEKKIWVPPEQLLEESRNRRKFTGKLQRLRQSLGIEPHKYDNIEIRTSEGVYFNFKVRTLDYADNAWIIGNIQPGQNLQEMTMYAQSVTLSIGIVGIGDNPDNMEDVTPVYEDMGVEIPKEILPKLNDPFDIPPPWRHITADIMLQFLQHELHPDVVDQIYEKYKAIWGLEKNPLILENTKEAVGSPLS